MFRCIPGAESYFSRQDTLSRAVHANAAAMLGSDQFVTMDHPEIEAMTPQLLSGHEQAFAAMKAERGNLPVGVTLSVTDFQPGGEGSPYRAGP